MSSTIRRSTTLAAVATALGLAAATQAGAQRPTTFPTDNAAIKRIWQIGMDSSRVEALGQALLDSIGPRLTGSPGMLAASDWAIAQYTSWGIEAKRENYGTWRGWRRGVSHIDLVAPRTRSLEGTMLAWSPGTKGKPVKARGKIVLLSPESKARMDTLVAQTSQDWAVMTGANGRPDSTKLYRGTGYGMGLGTGTLGLRLEKAGVVGMITSRNKLSGFANPIAAQNAGGGAGGAGGGSHVRGLLAGVPVGREQSEADGDARSRRRTAWRTAGVQHDRDDQGQREAR